MKITIGYLNRLIGILILVSLILFQVLFIIDGISFGDNADEVTKVKNLTEAKNTTVTEINNEKNIVMFEDSDFGHPFYKQHQEIQIFLNTAKSKKPTTDKVTTHSYQVMYGTFLLPFYEKKPNLKLLEIGLGCDMNYGPGASVAVWKDLLPEAELWEAEYDGACVERKKADGSLAGINTVVGDQGDPKVLHKWIKQSGGKFDVVIDDGGHQNCQIWNTWKKLWPQVNSGGLYFIEDMQVAKHPWFVRYSKGKCYGATTTVPKKMKAFVGDLMYRHGGKRDILFLFCQDEACVMGKK